ncbi:MAG: branched-chain amino acid transaminase [Bacteroidota bacterium]
MYCTENSIYFVDGNWVKASETNINVFNQTLHYGIGAFEGIRAYHSSTGMSLFKATEHYKRLINSVNTLHLKIDYTAPELVELTHQLLKKNNLRNAYVRPLVFMGPNMELTLKGKPRILIAAWEWGALLGKDQLDMSISTYQRPDRKSLPNTAKLTGNYTNSILASYEARKKGADEALMLDAAGNIAQAPGANFFLEKDGVLYTPQEGNILPGITRNTMFEFARELGFEIKEQDLSVDMIHEADSAFLTGTATEIVGVKSIEGVKMKMNWEDSMGAVLASVYQHRIKREESHGLTTIV